MMTKLSGDIKCDQRFIYSTQFDVAFDTILTRIKSTRHLMHVTGESKAPFHKSKQWFGKNRPLPPLTYICQGCVIKAIFLCSVQPSFLEDKEFIERSVTIKPSA